MFVTSIAARRKLRRNSDLHIFACKQAEAKQIRRISLTTVQQPESVIKRLGARIRRLFVGWEPLIQDFKMNENIKDDENDNSDSDSNGGEDFREKVNLNDISDILELRYKTIILKILACYYI
ncbi:unnamed protein product [Didymodactylos carnosus]|uniref:Uncharacterized protein n=1 Tax=Didymodactylos carnosus TaxID=1234261 RepID=A0A814PGK3_9BILA|nr:unnamed protein product [Didymodactylos carnosus]CAF3869221.1 unnamed protein product [Didymodactylos carnosus]